MWWKISKNGEKYWWIQKIFKNLLYGEKAKNPYLEKREKMFIKNLKNFFLSPLTHERSFGISFSS